MWIVNFKKHEKIFQKFINVKNAAENFLIMMTGGEHHPSITVINRELAVRLDELSFN